MEAHESDKRLEDYPPHLVAIALRRWEIIRPLLDIEQLTREAVRQRVLEVKSNLYRAGKPRIAVSIASIYRWIQLVRQSNGDVRSLIPHVRQGENRLRLDPVVEEIIELVIREMHWVGGHVTINIIQLAIAQRLQKINTTRPANKQLRLPSRATIARRLQESSTKLGELNLPCVGCAPPSHTRMFQHTSPQLTQSSSSLQQTKARSLTRPNQRVEYEAILLDAQVIDTEDQLPLGRPVVAVLRDCLTGDFTGGAISFEPPSSSTILEALYSAITAHYDILAQFHNEHDHLGNGLPEVLVVDHMSGWCDPRLLRICRHLGIDVQYEPRTRSPWKGMLEQHLQLSLDGQCAVIDDASCFSFLMQANGSKRDALWISLDKLWHTLHHRIVDVHRQTVYPSMKGDSSIPAVLQQQVREDRHVSHRLLNPMMASILLSRTTEGIMQSDGILFEHLRYRPSVMPSPYHAYSLPRPGRAVQVTYYPKDLTRLWVLDPSSRSSAELYAEDQAYTAHLSLWKHRVIQRYASSLATSGDEGTDTLLTQAKARLQEITTAFLQRSNDTVSSLAARPRFDHLAFRLTGEPPHRGHVDLSGSLPFSYHAVSPRSGSGHFSERMYAMTDRSHFEENPLDPKQWRTMTDLERYSSLQRLQIAHPRLKPLIKELDSYAYFSEQVSQGAPQSLAIMGEVGVGKTTLVRSWIETATLRQSMPSAERPTIPFVFCTLPANPTSKGILAACLSALGDPRPTYGGEWTMMERLQRLVRTSSVRMLFIDELQHLLNLETRRVRHAGVELLEQIINQTGVPVVFLGSQWETEAIIRASPRLEQLVGAPRILRPFEWNRNHPETILEFRSLMRAIDHHLPFDPSGLEEEDMAYRFYLASDGIIGWITKLIHYAAGEAIHMQAATLSRSLLAAAYETCIANTTIGMGKLNPFTMQHVPWEPNGARFLGNETFPLAIKQQRKRMVKEPKSAAMENEQQHSKRTIDEE